MKNLHLTLASLGIVFLVTGCGGGGSSSSSGGGNIPTAAIQITSANAQAVASGANSATQSTTNNGGSSASTVVGVVAQQSGHLPSVLSIATTEFNRMLNTNLPAATVVGVTNTYYYSCVTGSQVLASAPNTYTVSYSMAGSTFAAGDSFSVSFNSCADSSGYYTMNGSMTYAITSLSGTMGQVGASSGFRVTYSNLSVKDNTTNATYSLNGDMSIAASSTSVTGGASTTTGTSTTATISGSSLTMTDSVSGSFQLTNYSESYSYNSVTSVYTYSTNMTLAGTVMGGSVTVATTPPFSGTGANAPTSGSMKVSGANGSYVILTANPDGLNADLTIYDGSTTTNKSVLWSAL